MGGLLLAHVSMVQLVRLLLLLLPLPACQVKGLVCPAAVFTTARCCVRLMWARAGVAASEKTDQRKDR